MRCRLQTYQKQCIFLDQVLKVNPLTQDCRAINPTASHSHLCLGLLIFRFNFYKQRLKPREEILEVLLLLNARVRGRPLFNSVRIK